MKWYDIIPLKKKKGKKTYERNEQFHPFCPICSEMNWNDRDKSKFSPKTYCWSFWFGKGLEPKFFKNFGRTKPKFTTMLYTRGRELPIYTEKVSHGDESVIPKPLWSPCIPYLQQLLNMEQSPMVPIFYRLTFRIWIRLCAKY